MQERHFMLALLLFPWPRSAPPSFFILESPLHTTFFVSTQLRISELPR